MARVIACWACFGFLQIKIVMGGFLLALRSRSRGHRSAGQRAVIQFRPSQRRINAIVPPDIGVPWPELFFIALIGAGSRSWPGSRCRAGPDPRSGATPGRSAQCGPGNEGCSTSPEMTWPLRHARHTAWGSLERSSPPQRLTSRCHGHCFYLLSQPTSNPEGRPSTQQTPSAPTVAACTVCGGSTSRAPGPRSASPLSAWNTIPPRMQYNTFTQPCACQP